MAITRVLLDTTSKEANLESILDFIGSDLPEGVTIAYETGASNAYTRVRATSARMTSPVLVCELTGMSSCFEYAFKTSKGILIAQRDGVCCFAITTSNLGTDAIIGRSSGSAGSSLHVIDLTYSNSDATISTSQVKRDITSFTPIVLAEGTHTPYCYICHEAQNNSLVACTMMAGGKTFAYSGAVALED